MFEYLFYFYSKCCFPNKMFQSTKAATCVPNMHIHVRWPDGDCVPFYIPKALFPGFFLNILFKKIFVINMRSYYPRTIASLRCRAGFLWGLHFALEDRVLVLIMPLTFTCFQL